MKRGRGFPAPGMLLTLLGESVKVDYSCEWSISKFGIPNHEAPASNHHHIEQTLVESGASQGHVCQTAFSKSSAQYPQIPNLLISLVSVCLPCFSTDSLQSWADNK